MSAPRDQRSGFLSRAYALRPGLASSLALALLCSAAGCLIPSWELQPVEPAVNHPPLLLPETVKPELTYEIIAAEVGPGCAVLTFRATALDFDGDEQLFFKWIMTTRIDNRVKGAMLQEGFVTASDTAIDEYLGEGAQAAMPSARVYTEIKLVVDESALLNEFDDVQNLKDTALLELWVSDRRFVPGKLEVTPQPLSGETAQPAVSAAWLIQVKRTPDCVPEVEQ
jgi:hypothetical protein